MPEIGVDVFDRVVLNTVHLKRLINYAWADSFAVDYRMVILGEVMICCIPTFLLLDYAVGSYSSNTGSTEMT